MTFITTFQAIDNDGELKTWFGPKVYDISWGMAEQQLLNQGKTYLKIHGILHSELPEVGNGLEGEVTTHTDN